MSAAVWFPGTVGTHFAGRLLARVCPQCGATLNLLTGPDGRTDKRLNTGCHACPRCEHVEADIPRKKGARS